jgi:hypothetical protein
MKMGKDFSPCPFIFFSLARFLVSDPRGMTFSRATRD